MLDAAAVDHHVMGRRRETQGPARSTSQPSRIATRCSVPCFSPVSARSWRTILTARCLPSGEYRRWLGDTS